ncbi:MAG: hypothetical protein HYS07_07705 [Chlamydiae bacterium]|nr:hypothetical protein [Chlamydiota bacterium]MBI3277562.1 hypothetical protein [Chlamydiota bacterium]
MNIELTHEELKGLRVQVLKVHDLLQDQYGKQEREGKKNPLDELILTILSQNTSRAHAQESFDKLWKKYKGWEALMNAPSLEISKTIQNGGLHHTKAIRMRRILKRIYKDRGDLSLDFLREKDQNDAMKYLISLKGLGPRTASHILLYSLNQPVMPVDTHVTRVSKRLGWVWDGANREVIQQVMNRATPRYLILSLYSQLMKHGQVTCKLKAPRCMGCVIRNDCEYYKNRDKR